MSETAQQKLLKSPIDERIFLWPGGRGSGRKAIKQIILMQKKMVATVPNDNNVKSESFYYSL